MVGCSYDDSAILDKIAEMEKEHAEMQEQLDAQQALLNALSNKLTITNIVQTTDGYTITFSDGTTANIKNGKMARRVIKATRAIPAHKATKVMMAMMATRSLPML